MNDDNINTPKVKVNPGPMQSNRLSFLKSKKILIPGLLIALLIVGSVYYFSHHRHLPTLPILKKNYVPTAAKQGYTYTKLESFSLADNPKAAGVSFSKPPELKLFGKLPADPQQALFIQIPADKSAPDIGRIAIVSVKGQPPSADYLKNFSQGLTNPKGSSYNSYLKILKNFINSRMPILHEVNDMSVPKPFINSNIKDNAWISDFVATRKNNNVTTIKGRVILVYGQKGTYFFMAENVEPTWSSNTKIWQQVFDSLRIDQ